MTETSAQMGKNLTGIDIRADLAESTAQGARDGTTHPGHDLGPQMALRQPYLDEHAKIGSVPPPGNIKGMAKTGMEMLKGNKANVLIDRLGERLAFERTGTRLYEAIIAKAEQDGGAESAHLQTLRDYHQEELAHFRLLKGHIERLGADPTAVTPAADVAGVAASGVLQIATDPRMTLSQSLEALLVAELADNDGWAMLIDLAKDMGQDAMAWDFEQARVEEEQHLESVRHWIKDHRHSEASLVG